MNALNLISLVEKSGCQLFVEGENIRVVKIKLLPLSLVEEIRSQKNILLKILNQGVNAKNAGFMTGLTGELYFRTSGKNSAVYIERTGNQWEAWRETHIQDKKEPFHFLVIAVSEDFEFVLLKAKNYFEYIERLGARKVKRD
ncbi:hypothetical protein KW850_30475 [Bacillus sp. sid0103]|uniref:hypothetical protein n=1 Tax=Bacillus sp. sid0103 TaxID=2856337 RepID=UPI001C45D2F8|nr:hypothetical protein [Bacillus sp. sid0103]MBV7509487.1 hypothetical protein [Bacillus sp. sid0103]